MSRAASGAHGLSPRKQAAFTAAVRLVLGRCGLDVAESEFGKARPHGVATSDNATHAERIGQRREVTETIFASSLAAVRGRLGR